MNNLKIMGKGSELFFKELISDNDQSFYYQMYDSIRVAILDQRLKPGEKLPPTRAIAKFCNVSRSTVQTAFDLLMAEGYIIGKVGSGTFVNNNLPEKFLTAQSSASTSVTKYFKTPNFSEYGVRIRRSSFKNTKYKDIIPFQPGIPSLKDFPFDLWFKITNKSVKDLSHRNMGFSDPMGLLKLRDMIAIYLRQSRGVKCNADQIVIINGSQQAFTLVSKMFLNKGDEIIVEDPAYPGALEAFKTTGAKVTSIPVDSDGIDVKKIIQSDSKAKLFYTTPSHQFPLGSTLSLKRRLQLLDWATKNSALILENDFDSEYRFSGNPFSSLQGLAEKSPVIYIDTFSLVLYPGIRLGYMVLPSNLVESFALAKTIFDRNAPMLEQLILARFIEEGHFGRHLRRMRIIYQERQHILISEFNKHLARFGSIDPCQAGLHVIARLQPGFIDDDISQKAASANINVPALSRYCSNRNDLNGLIFGYSAFDSEEIKSSMIELKKVFSK